MPARNRRRARRITRRPDDGQRLTGADADSNSDPGGKNTVYVIDIADTGWKYWPMALRIA